jgi:hypothetical protein
LCPHVSYFAPLGARLAWYEHVHHNPVPLYNYLQKRRHPIYPCKIDVASGHDKLCYDSNVPIFCNSSENRRICTCCRCKVDVGARAAMSCATIAECPFFAAKKRRASIFVSVVDVGICRQKRLVCQRVATGSDFNYLGASAVLFSIINTNTI